MDAPPFINIGGICPPCHIGIDAPADYLPIAEQSPISPRPWCDLGVVFSLVMNRPALFARLSQTLLQPRSGSIKPPLWGKGSPEGPIT